MPQVDTIIAGEPGIARMEAAWRYSDELLYFLTKRVGCLDEAAELRQETFLRLGRMPDSPIGEVRAYLFQIARNLMIDTARRRRRDVATFEGPANENLASDLPTPETVAADSSELEALKRTLAELPERQRMALLWYRLDNLPLREIGRRLGVSESMAGRYVSKALGYCQVRLAR